MTGDAVRRSVVVMIPEPLCDTDLVARFETAWRVVDPNEDHEAQERTWMAPVHAGMPRGDAIRRSRLRGS
jgi:hypothetical protein